jgi:predicted metal-dependent hydrolase
MPSKDFTLDGGLSVTVHKRKTSRSLRLSIAPTGEVRVSIPAWAPYRVGVNFAASRQAWIRSQQPAVHLLKQDQAIGKAHHLQFVPQPGAAKTISRVGATTVVVRHPPELDVSSPDIQRVAEKACVRALRAQAEQLLPQRLAKLADTHGFTYAGVSIKRLTGRWGSCDQRQQIVLNLFLMQLPWELIDYVLLHELTHTVVLRHGPDFWQHLATVLPDFARRKKTMRQYHPVLAGVA